MYRAFKAIGACILMTIICSTVFAADPPEPTNGVSYILLPSEFGDNSGVYRLNSYVKPYDPLGLGKRVFDLQFGKSQLVSGISVDRENNVAFLAGGRDSKPYYRESEFGWMPELKFSSDSKAFLRLIGQEFNQAELSQDIEGPLPHLQFTYRTTNYDTDFWDYAHWPISPHFPEGSQVKHEAFQKTTGKDKKGKIYDYVFQPPALGFYRNLALWSGPAQKAAGQVGSEDPQSVVLPNLWGGISYYAMGSPNAPAKHINRLMTGENELPRYITSDLRLKHDNTPTKDQVPKLSPYWDALYFIPVVKRTFERRTRSMDLFSFFDDEAPPEKPPYKKYPGSLTAKVLKAEDWKIVDYFTKSTGNGDIQGGDVTPNVPEKLEPHVQVINATSGRSYSFNPAGKKTGKFKDEEAALHVVFKGKVHSFELKPEFVKNSDYFSFLGINLEDTKQIAISANFEIPLEPLSKPPDFIFASTADRFVMQDSWWGNGGTAYEYYAGEKSSPKVASLSFKAGHIYRLNFFDNSRPIPVDLGEFPGDVDDIAVDGQGNLYVMVTELDLPNDPGWPDQRGMPQGPNLPAEWPNSGITGHKLFLRQSPWMRVGVEKPDYPVDEPKKDDYKDIVFAQKVKKIVYKYAVGSGGVYNQGGKEIWGTVEAGNDEIVRKLVCDGRNYFWKDDWYHRNLPGNRLAAVDAELAVVNFAARPEVMPLPPDCGYSICRNDSAGGGKRVSSAVPINEGEQVTFKLEGYKPYDDSGSRQELKYVGAIEGLGTTRVNLIPPFENRDEDGDGSGGCFPSSMFETAANSMSVLWGIDLIEGTDPNNEDKVVRSFVTNGSPNAGNKNFTFKFPHPGNYRVFAKIQYRYFDFAELIPNARPDSLKDHVKNYPSSGEYVSTKKIMYQVQSPPSTQGGGYVSEVVLYNQNYNQYVSAVSESGDVYNMPENTSPTDLKFSFVAQFVRDANRFDTELPYLTFGGVGVWDYGDKDGHVYNFEGPNSANSEFNPGWQKPNDGMNLADHGTRVDVPPREKDLKGLRWRLFLYSDFGSNLMNQSKLRSKKETGVMIAEGDCSKARLEPASQDRKFKIFVDIPPDAVALKMPLDPLAYKLRLELVYPRVKWVEYQTGNAEKPQYRSIVPDDNPIGIITSVIGSEDDTLYEDANVFTNGDSWYVRVRDTQIFTPAMIEGSPGEIIQTTGDPLAPVVLKYNVTDNNPNAEFDQFGIRYETPQSKRDPSKKDDRSFSEGKLLEPITEPPYDSDAFSTGEYRKIGLYQSSIPEYGDAFGKSSLFSSENDFENWVGSLSYWIEGDLQDGYGATSPLSLSNPHHFAAFSSDAMVRTPVNLLNRYDNDPPTMRVSIISTSDNRRWEVALEENIKDLKADPQSVAMLASSVLKIACYRLDTKGKESIVVATQTVEIPGSSNVPHLLNTYKDIKFTDISPLPPALAAALPRIRRSSRVMVNVQIEDNVDYMPLTAAGLEILENKTVGAPMSLLPPNDGGISLEPAFTSANAPNYDLPNPRGRFSVDMPMVVRADQSLPGKPQVSVKISTTDAAGNERSINIPIQIVDSTFETRILESKEQRQ